MTGDVASKLTIVSGCGCSAVGFWSAEEDGCGRDHAIVYCKVYFFGAITGFFPTGSNLWQPSFLPSWLQPGALQQ